VHFCGNTAEKRLKLTQLMGQRDSGGDGHAMQRAKGVASDRRSGRPKRKVPSGKNNTKSKNSMGQNPLPNVANTATKG
jgi:hypothetical protein